jgi:sulfonate transport system substrate-binding protein
MTVMKRLRPLLVLVLKGQVLLDALNAGAIDFGYTGDTPSIFAQAADAGAALRSGSVDAWAIWDPFYAST